MVRYAGGHFNEFKTVDGAPNGLMTVMYVDAQGRVWAGSSQSGVSRIDDPSAAHPKFVTYTTDNGLASNNVKENAKLQPTHGADSHRSAALSNSERVHGRSPDHERRQIQDHFIGAGWRRWFEHR